MASLGSLVIQMAVDTAKFQGDLGRAAAMAESRMRNIRDTAKKTVAALSVIGTAVGGALVAATKQAINAADEMRDLAAAAGTTTERMSQLGYAAAQSGADVEGVRKAMVKLANDGAPDAYEALLDLADEFSRMPDGAIKTAKAVEKFGERIGPGLIPLLNEGRAGIAALGKEADQLGITIDTKTAKAANEFNDKLTTISASVTGLKMQMAEQLLPALNSLTAELVKTVKGGDGVSRFATIGANVLRVFATVVTGLATAFDKLGITIGARVAQLTALARFDFRAVSSIQAELTADMEAYTAKQRSLYAAIWNTEESLLTRSSGVLASVNAVIAQGDAIIADAFERSAKAEADAAKRREAAAKAAIERQMQLADAYKGVLEAGMAAIQSQESPSERIVREFEEQRFALEKLMQTYPQFAVVAQEALARAAASADEQLEAIKRVEPQVEVVEDRMSTFAEQAARNMQSSLAQFLFDPFEDGLKGMLRGFSDMLRQMLAELAAQQLLKSFFNWGSGLGGSTGTFFAGLSSSFGGARAAGGPVSGGRSYLVGERGPELFVPGSSGTIVPNGAGGLTIAPVYNIDARGATQDVIRALPAILEESNRRAVAMAKAGIRGDVRRFGRVR